MNELTDVSTKLTLGLITLGLNHYGLSMYHDNLMNYLLLLKKWNQTYNLTSVRQLSDMVTRHILDSLAIRPWIHGSRVIDVGTGAGLPGIPLAITMPDTHFVLLDSNGKKTRFLSEVKRSLGLVNITIEQSRAEHYRPSCSFDTVISRALCDLKQLINWTQHLIAHHGIWLAMKGHHPESELDRINRPYQVHHYQVPGLDHQRCSVIIEQPISACESSLSQASARNNHG